jgi:hypothetical protein
MRHRPLIHPAHVSSATGHTEGVPPGNAETLMMDGVFGGHLGAGEGVRGYGGKGSKSSPRSVTRVFFLRLYGAKFRTRNGRVFPFYAGGGHHRTLRVQIQT